MRKLQYKGYIKDLQSLNFQSGLNNLVSGNLIHNRFNFKWLPSNHFTGGLEIRNRLFWGEEVKLTPTFSSQLRNANEAVDMSWNWVDEDAVVFNSQIDRLWVQYEGAKWNIRLGRQRINWGIGSTWNPNDLFNTFNFLDFDYEERPGVDGLKFQYLTGLMDHIELALSYSEASEDIIASAKYFKNIAEYDLQLLAGSFHKQLTFGFGWSGSIKDAGFKGEAQYYVRNIEYDEQLNFVVETDYMFENGWYLNTGAFLNSKGINSPTSAWELGSLKFDPRNLMPTKWNLLFTTSKEITPLLQIGSTIIYAPRIDLLLILPTLSYSMTEDLDIGLIWQSYFSEQPSGFEDLAHRCFFRLKWSY